MKTFGYLSESENSSNDNKLSFETYSNDYHDLSYNEPLQEEEDYEWDEYGNLLDKYK